MRKQQKKSKSPEERELEIQSAKLFGKHVSARKGRALLAVTLLACAMPMVLGARLWSEIPETVPSGLIGTDGRDDSIPRWMVVCGLPGLMCLLNLICHMQLLVSQRRMTLPATHIRLVGRWGFPILSVLFCSGMMLQSAGRGLSLRFAAPCVLGLTLMMLGAHLFDCPREAVLALRVSSDVQDDACWQKIHRLTAWCWMGAGLWVIAAAMLYSTLPPFLAAFAALALAAPVAYGRRYSAERA